MNVPKQILKITVAGGEGTRLDRALSLKSFPEKPWFSRTVWKKLFDIKAVRDGSQRVWYGGDTVRGNLELEVQLPGSLIYAENSAEENSAVSINKIYLHPERAFAAFNKPAGIPSIALLPWEHGSFAELVGNHLAATRVLGKTEYYSLGPPPSLEGGLVQRLDNDTSGIMIVALHAEAKTVLRKIFSEHGVRKKYLAIVRGEWRKDISQQFFYIEQTQGHKVSVANMGSGENLRKLTVDISAKSVANGHSLIEFSTTEGIRHQVRAVCAHLGFPLLGDSVYALGEPAATIVADVRYHQLHAAELTLPQQRYSLSATRLSCEPPPSFIDILSRLGLYYSHEAPRA